MYTAYLPAALRQKFFNISLKEMRMRNFIFAQERTEKTILHFSCLFTSPGADIELKSSISVSFHLRVIFGINYTRTKLYKGRINLTNPSTTPLFTRYVRIFSTLQEKKKKNKVSEVITIPNKRTITTLEGSVKGTYRHVIYDRTP